MKQSILETIKIKIYPDNNASAEDENGEEIYYPAIGIRAEAKILIPDKNHSATGGVVKGSYTIQTISSGGLWGISDETEESDLLEIVAEQMEDLKYLLSVLNVHTTGERLIFNNKPRSKSFEELQKEATETQKTQGFFINA